MSRKVTNAINELRRAKALRRWQKNHGDRQIRINSQKFALYTIQTQVLQEGPISQSNTVNIMINLFTYNKLDIVNRIINLSGHNTPQPRNIGVVVDTIIVPSC